MSDFYTFLPCAFFVATTVVFAVLFFSVRKNLKNFERESSRIASEFAGELETSRRELNEAKVETAICRTQKQDSDTRLAEAFDRIATLESLKEKADKLSAAQERENKLLQQTLQETEQRYAKIRQQLNDDFQILANKIFDSVGEKFASVGAEKISSVVNPLSQNIQDFRKRIDAIHDAETKQSAGVSAQIESLLQMNNKLSDEAKNLANALRSNNKIAGNWGETVLERIFESCGFIKDIHFRTQTSFSDSTSEQTRLIPDFIVDLPDNRSIIVDSKLSLVDYVDYCSSDDAEKKRQSLERFKKSTRSHLRDFAKKYNTLDSFAGFKLMFMPVEPAYNLIVEADKTLLADAYRENVIIVSPVSVMAILKYAQIAYRNEAYAKNMGELSKQGRLLCERIERFLKRFNSIQDKINSLQKEYNDTKSALNDGSQSVASTAKRFHELSAKSIESESKKNEMEIE